MDLREQIGQRLVTGFPGTELTEDFRRFDPAFGGCTYRSVRTVKADAFLEEARHETVDE